MPGVVQRLERQAAAERGIPDADRDPLPAHRVATRELVARRGEPHADAHPGASMPAVEDVVRALGPPREATHASDLAQRRELLIPPGQELVRVGLVSGVPHDPVARRVHRAVQREGDLHRAQRRGEVPAGLRDGPDHLLAQLGSQRGELRVAHATQLGGVGQGGE